MMMANSYSNDDHCASLLRALILVTGGAPRLTFHSLSTQLLNGSSDLAVCILEDLEARLSRRTEVGSQAHAPLTCAPRCLQKFVQGRLKGMEPQPSSAIDRRQEMHNGADANARRIWNFLRVSETNRSVWRIQNITVVLMLDPHAWSISHEFLMRGPHGLRLAAPSSGSPSQMHPSEWRPFRLLSPLALMVGHGGAIRLSQDARGWWLVVELVWFDHSGWI